MPAQPVYASNGAITVAYPIDEVVIDGKLGEWGEEHATLSIAWLPSDEAPDAEDSSATFRVAYSQPEKALGGDQRQHRLPTCQRQGGRARVE